MRPRSRRRFARSGRKRLNRSPRKPRRRSKPRHARNRAMWRSEHRLRSARSSRRALPNGRAARFFITRTRAAVPPSTGERGGVGVARRTAQRWSRCCGGNDPRRIIGQAAFLEERQIERTGNRARRWWRDRVGYGRIGPRGRAGSLRAQSRASGPIGSSSVRIGRSIA